ncbi:hypothetical protein ACFE04_028309 [Oxalis oulophora]
MARTAEKLLIGFDMAPQLDINTVAAGSGSNLKFQFGAFCVGPEWVGAHPCPVCYRKEGELAIADSNLVLGFVIPDYFPSIFGPKENQLLDIEATRKEFEKLAIQVNSHRKSQDDSATYMLFLSQVEGIMRKSAPIFEEGAAIKAFKLVQKEIFQEEGIIKLLTESIHNVPGTRKLQDNLSDLRAQVAANQRGISLIKELYEHYGLETVQAYMS